jgi:hypothetical protein
MDSVGAADWSHRTRRKLERLTMTELIGSMGSRCAFQGRDLDAAYRNAWRHTLAIPDNGD